jgi:hypothetical protein
MLKDRERADRARGTSRVSDSCWWDKEGDYRVRVSWVMRERVLRAGRRRS